MILTNCAACAAPLAHNAPRCIRCHTRYCDSNCQHDHRTIYAQNLYYDRGATLDDLLEAVTTLQETTRIARGKLGGAHPLTAAIERDLQKARAAFRARETPPLGRTAETFSCELDSDCDVGID